MLMNQLGSYRRLELALGAPLDDIAQRGAFCEVVVDPPDLGRLPVLTTWPGRPAPRRTRRPRLP